LPFVIFDELLKNFTAVNKPLSQGLCQQKPAIDQQGDKSLILRVIFYESSAKKTVPPPVIDIFLFATPLTKTKLPIHKRNTQRPETENTKM